MQAYSHNQLNEISKTIEEEHINYYSTLLSYNSDHDNFKKQSTLENSSNDPNVRAPKHERILERKPDRQFLEGFNKMKTLLFFLRDNEEVFRIFARNAYKVKKGADRDRLAEAVTNLLYNDLTSPNPDRRLVLFLKEMIHGEMQQIDSQ